MSEQNHTAELVGALAKIMAAAGSVEKRGRNDFHRYDYATASDVMHKLQPLMAEQGVIVFQTEKSRDLIMGETAMAVTYEFTIAHRSGAVWPEKPVQTGVAAAKTSKGSPDDKCVNKCHTAARKYFLLALFQIPTGDFDDADADGDVPSATSGSVRGPVDRSSSPPPPPVNHEALSFIAQVNTALRNCSTPAEIMDLFEQYKSEREGMSLSTDQDATIVASFRRAKIEVAQSTVGVAA